MKRTARLSLFLGLIGTLSACAPASHPNGSSAVATGIVGGQNSAKGTREQSVVVFLLDRSTNKICTGTLIASDMVLTAGHCLKTAKIDRMFVSFGLNGFTLENARQAVDAKVHPDYKRAPEEPNDIAVLRFTGGLPEGADVALLPDESTQDSPVESFTAIGYGRNEGRIHKKDENGKPLPTGSGTLRQKTLTIEFFDGGRRDFAVNQSESGGMCNGDSGGPALVERDGGLTVIGVASNTFQYETNTSSPDFNFCQTYAAYQDVRYYTDWINDSMKALRKKKK